MKPIVDFLNKVHQGNNLDILKEVPDESVDCMVTDPPYALVSDEYKDDKEFSGGFMGKSWDSKLPSVEMWKECLRVLKHGAFAFILCSPRQDVFSRMIINLQDAGFRTDMTSIYHTYSSGFPKAGNISKMIDKKLGFQRERIGTKYDLLGHGHKLKGQLYHLDNDRKWIDNPDADAHFVSLPSSPEAKEFEGAYTFSPKPAVEIVITVMRPLSEKSFTGQCLKNGHGVVYFGNCRIPFKSKSDYNEVVNNFKGGIERASPEEKESWRLHEGGWRLGEGIDIPDESRGRFPANLLCSSGIDVDINMLIKAKSVLNEKE